MKPEAEGGAAAAASKSADHTDAEDTPRIPSSATAIHGLIVLMLLLSGMVIFEGSTSWGEQSKPDQYLKVAATASLLSIAAGINPHFIHQIAQLFSIERRPPGPVK